MPWWVALGTAAAGYFSADQANDAAAKASKGAGQVGLTQSNQPWGPDAQYRMWMMDAGADVLGMPRNDSGKYANPYAPLGGSQTGSTWPGVTSPGAPVRTGPPPDPKGRRPGGVGGGGGNDDGGDPDPFHRDPAPAATPPPGLNAKQQKQWRAEQERKAGANGKARTAGQGGPNTTASPGTNVTTQQVMDAMYRDIQAPNRTEDAAVNYTNTLLGGGETNAYRTEAAQRVRDASSNENLDRYIAALWAGENPGGGGGATTSAKGTRAYSATAGVGGVEPSYEQMAGRDLVGAKEELKKVYAGQGIPQEYRDMLERQYKEAAEKNARDMNAIFVGANMQGSSSWQDAFARGQSDASQGYSDALIGANFGLYGEALGLGTQYDMSALDRAAQAQAAAQASSASAGAYSAGLAQEGQLAKMRMLGDAIGMQQQGQQFGAQGMTGISGLYSGDTQQALGMVPDLSNLNTAAWGSLGNVGVGRDQVAASIKNANTAASTQRGIANQQIGWERDRYNDPLARLGRYADLVNASSASYGTQITAGTDQRNAAAPGYVSPWGQAISSGMAGYSMASGR